VESIKKLLEGANKSLRTIKALFQRKERLMFAILNNFVSKFKPKFDRKVYNELIKLSDYELNDMGISRCDIKHIASGGQIYRGTH
jgi:hypothetical protein